MYLDMDTTIGAIEIIRIIRAIIETTSIHVDLIKYTSRDQMVNFINSKVKIYHKIKLRGMSHKKLFLNTSIDQTHNVI
jgi:hypothetical protein